MSRNKIDLIVNCDMGEWDAPHLNPIDSEIMPYVDLCNIACGGHAGSDEIIRKTIEIAIKNNVKVGAHPGFEDRANFGRKYIQYTQTELYDSLKRQLESFLTVCSKLNVQPYHIKAHGALYHACNQSEMESMVLINLVKELYPTLIILVAPESTLAQSAKRNGLSILAESFIDRRYNDDLTLVSRTEINAVITDTEVAKGQFESLSIGEVLTKTGKIKELLSHTACIHGDNPNCLQILKTIRNHG